jgi:hypothetical protein
MKHIRIPIAHSAPVSRIAWMSWISGIAWIPYIAKVPEMPVDHHVFVEFPNIGAGKLVYVLTIQLQRIHVFVSPKSDCSSSAVVYIISH